MNKRRSTKMTMYVQSSTQSSLLSSTAKRINGGCFFFFNGEIKSQCIDFNKQVNGGWEINKADVL